MRISTNLRRWLRRLHDERAPGACTGTRGREPTVRQGVRAAVTRLSEATAPDIARTANLVVANPPYVAPERDGGTRLRRPVPGRIASRRGALAPFVRAAAAALGGRGRACFVYPAHALLELMTLARASGLEAKRLRFVHGKGDRPARVALVELASAKPGGLVVLPPLVEVRDNGKPTAELASLLRIG